MSRPKNNRVSRNGLGINLRALRKEIKMIPFDIKKEMRLLDLLFNERSASRTQVEKDVLVELIENARGMINVHQDKLERFQRFYKQMRSGKHSDLQLLTAEELHLLQKASSLNALKKREKEEQRREPREPLRTGTHG